MTKTTKEEKIRIILRYIDGQESLNQIAREENVHQAELSTWIRLYEHHGFEGFAKPYTSYSAQFKMDVLNYMNETGMSTVDAAAIFNISSSRLIRKWRNQFETGGFDALQSKKKGRSSMNKETKNRTKSTPAEGSVEALEARIKQLEMENAYLKKLNTLVQMQEKLQTKSKRK